MIPIRRQGCVNVAMPKGSLTGDAVESLREALERLGNERPSYLVLELSEVPLLDSSALELILDLQEEAVRHGGDVKLSGVNALCGDILAVTEIDRQVAIFPDAFTAIGSFSR